LRDEDLYLCRNAAANPVTGRTSAFLKPAVLPEKAAVKMETRLYVGNLSKSTTEEELNTLFAQAGEVTTVEVIKERKSGESKGFAFVTMGEQSGADKAVTMFNAYSLSDHALKVSPAKPREERAGIVAT
jgi:RNA recognition motif-containing protein